MCVGLELGNRKPIAKGVHVHSRLRLLGLLLLSLLGFIICSWILWGLHHKHKWLVHTDFIMSCIHGVVRNRQLHLAGSTDGIGIHVLGIVIYNSTNPTCICQQKLAFQFNTLPPRHLQAPGSQLRVPPGCQQREGFEGD